MTWPFMLWMLRRFESVESNVQLKSGYGSQLAKVGSQ